NLRTPPGSQPHVPGPNSGTTLTTPQQTKPAEQQQRQRAWQSRPEPQPHAQKQAQQQAQTEPQAHVEQVCRQWYSPGSKVRRHPAT
ncbi:hypothetical protein KEM55_000103, partial [Ascosphaera atra]